MKETATDILTQQQERLAKIGAYLQQIRIAKGWSLDFTARRTKIRTTLLKHIETGCLDDLPEPIYLQGLIRCYADCLGLDGQAIANSFTVPPEKLRYRWKLPNPDNFSLQFQLRPVHLYLVYLFVIVTTVQSLSNMVRIPNTAVVPELDPALRESSTPVSSGTAQIQPAATLVKNPPATPAVTPESKSVVIDIKTEETSWMRVEIDGKTAFEGTLPKGTQKQWVADESVKIRAGNAGAVYITINDEQPHPLGEPGSVEEFTYQALADEKPKTQAPS